MQRALVMDESITPLLYRVNGLYKEHDISSVLVIGGVGDWLDVPNAVIRLEKYVASDALKKAKSSKCLYCRFMCTTYPY